MQLTDIDLEKAMTERQDSGVKAPAISPWNGKHRLNVQELARNLNGSAQFPPRTGADRHECQQLPPAVAAPAVRQRRLPNGRTPFDKLNIALQIVQGTATIDDVHLEGPKVKLGLTGTTSIPAREFDLAGTASLINATADAGTAFELPFVVQGPWDDPVMLPDAQTLIKRSVPAAPLLDAVRDRKTRDALESSIRRLTGPALDRNPR